MSGKRDAVEAVNQLRLLVKLVDVGPIASDIEEIARWLVHQLNNEGEDNIATLARIARALSGGKA